MSAPDAEKRKRPLSVTVVAGLAALVAIYSLVNAGLAIESGEDDRVLDAAFSVVRGLALLVAAVGALVLRPWAWAVFMTWAVASLTHQILRYLFFEDPNYVDMAVSTFAVLALSPLDVQIAFGLRHTENVQLERATRNPVDGH